MWNPPEDVTVVTTTRRRGWFPFPNGVPERLEKLETWKKSPKHQLFSKTWARANAEEFLNDYEQLILSAVQKLWKNRPRLRMASSASAMRGEGEANATSVSEQPAEAKRTEKHEDVEVMSGDVTFGAEFQFKRDASGHGGSTLKFPGAVQLRVHKGVAILFEGSVRASTLRGALSMEDGV